MTTLEFVNVSKRYRVRGASSMLALDEVSFTLHDRETIALVGQSGSGKSTIAKILTQLETPTSGEVLLDGKPIPRHGRGLRRLGEDKRQRQSGGRRPAAPHGRGQGRRPRKVQAP